MVPRRFEMPPFLLCERDEQKPPSATYFFVSHVATHFFRPFAPCFPSRWLHFFTPVLMSKLPPRKDSSKPLQHTFLALLLESHVFAVDCPFVSSVYVPSRVPIPIADSRFLPRRAQITPVGRIPCRTEFFSVSVALL